MAKLTLKRKVMASSFDSLTVSDCINTVLAARKLIAMNGIPPPGCRSGKGPMSKKRDLQRQATEASDKRKKLLLSDSQDDTAIVAAPNDPLTYIQPRSRSEDKIDLCTSYVSPFKRPIIQQIGGNDRELGDQYDQFWRDYFEGRPISIEFSLAFDDLTIGKLPNVHAADFVVAHRNNGQFFSLALALAYICAGLVDVEQLLKSRATTWNISYNLPTRTVGLLGHTSTMTLARKAFEARLHSILLQSTLQFKFCFPVSSSKPLLNSKTLNTDSPGRTLNKVFAIRAKDDAYVVDTWNNYILPNLTTILKENAGNNHTACLVRIGPSTVLAQPCIQMESPLQLSKGNKHAIKKKIAVLCRENARCAIYIQFLIGRMIPLAGHEQETTDMSEILDDKDDDENSFPFYRRYWQKPGMGASIGMNCTQSVSATLGVYVLVDSELLMLTVDHFIGKSQENKNNLLLAADQKFALTSPSLRDIRDIRERLKQSERGIKADMQNCLEQHGETISSRKVNHLRSSSGDLRTLEGDLNRVAVLMEELEKNDTEYLFGNIVHRCDPLPINALGPSDMTSDCRMDWALFSVTNRRGQNRHRHPYMSGEYLDHFGEDANPFGGGPLCDDTCDLEPDARVHYVGSRSGLHRGTVNATKALCCGEGVTTYECHMIPDQDVSICDKVTGDSGAFVIRDHDNKGMGLLHAWDKGKLIFTPIRELFKDMKRVTGATDICLPKHASPVALPVPGEMRSICRVEALPTGPPKPYHSFGGPETKLTRKPQRKPTLIRPVSAHHLYSSNNTSDIVETRANSGSPMPSLVHSNTSSPDIQPQTPPPTLYSHSTRRKSPTDEALTLQVGGGTVGGESSPCALENTKPNKEEADSANSKHSLQYDLYPVNQSKHFLLPDSRLPITPARKSSTLPPFTPRVGIDVLKSAMSIVA